MTRSQTVPMRLSLVLAAPNARMGIIRVQMARVAYYAQMYITIAARAAQPRSVHLVTIPALF